MPDSRVAERALWVIVTVVLLFLALKSVTTSQRQFQEASQRISANERWQVRLQERIARLEDDLNEARGQELSSDELEDLEDQGLKEPTRSIVKDLKNHTHLVSYKRGIGGQMYFSNIRVMSSRWVVASFEDAHVSGKALLTYKVAPGGKIT